MGTWRGASLKTTAAHRNVASSQIEQHVSIDRHGGRRCWESLDDPLLGGVGGRQANK